MSSKAQRSTDTDDEKKASDSHTSFKTIILSGLLSLSIALATTFFSSQAQQAEFIRNERSQVYANFLEASQGYQNALTRYTFIVPAEDGDWATIEVTEAEPAYREVMDARESYVNARAKARLLQDLSAEDAQVNIDEALYETHEELEFNATQNILGTHTMTTQQIRDLAGTSFNEELNGLRDEYIDAVRGDFHGRPFWETLNIFQGG